MKHEKLQVLVEEANPHCLEVDEGWAWGRSLHVEVEGYFPPTYVSLLVSIQDAHTRHVLTIEGSGGKPYLAPWSESQCQLWFFTATKGLRLCLNGHVLAVDERASGKPIVLVDPASSDVAGTSSA